MNLKNVLKTYSLLRQLSDDETALLNTLREMNDAERELLVESLQPEKSAKPERNQQARCTHIYSSGLVCNGVARNTVHHNSAHLDFHQFTTEKAKKSKHAQSLAGAIQQRAPKSKADEEKCVAVIEVNGDKHPCLFIRDNPIHDMAYLSSHEFVSEKSAARSAAAKSSANSEAAASTVSSEEQTENAADAAGGSNE